MIQIKTIWERADFAEEFDARVNESIADGWELARREVIPGSTNAGLILHNMFYAELVKETEPEAQTASWLITRDPSLPYRCSVCGYKTDLPADQCPGCDSYIDWEDSEA